MAAPAKQRDHSFDIAKGLAIYLVVLGHTTTAAAVRIPIDFTHMPLFFFVSGWFFAKTFAAHPVTGGGPIKCKARRLLVPFLLWSLVALLFNVVLGFAARGARGALLPGYVATQAVDIFIHVRSLWFLLVLFLTFAYLLLCQALACKLHVNRYVVALVGWVLLYVFVPDNHDASLLGLYKFEWLFPFFVGGCLLKDSRVAVRAKGFYGRHRVVSCVGLLAAVVLMYVCFDRQLFDVWGVPNVFAWESPLAVLGIAGYYVLGLLGVVGLLVASGSLAKTRACAWLSELGMYSLDVYVLHMFFVKAFLMVLPAGFIDSPLGCFVVAPVFSLVVVVAIWAAVKFVLNKFKPYVALMRG